MLGGKVLFPGRDCTNHCLLLFNYKLSQLDVQQLNLIIAVVGTPADDTIARIGSHRVNFAYQIYFSLLT
jgi:hypothetical protein